ncbi:MAG: DUF4143 domain-containing protein [Thermoplasmata archaeon]|nr:DUF4143 domain-containing protein [Thermoplasmata archaeon]
MTDYRPRLVDSKLEHCLRVFGAVYLVGPKWCGKTTTAARLAKSSISMQDPNYGARNRNRAKLMPSEVLKGDNPRLIDEWQEVPQLWDAVRVSVDERSEKGLYILTGSSSATGEGTRHTGTGRIFTLRMGTMSLFESGDSSGSVSLRRLFDGEAIGLETSDVTLQQVAALIIRGGWPESLGMKEEDAILILEGYCEGVVNAEMSGFGGKRRNADKVRAVLRSLSRSTSAPLSNKGIVGDVSTDGAKVSENTVNEYLHALRGIHLLEDMQAWNPNLRSKAAIRTAPTVHFCDPAVSAYFLTATVQGLMDDPATFGLLFESLVVRDLRAYVRAIGGEVYHYRDSDGAEADAVVHLNDGRWALFEAKLGESWIDDAAKGLQRVRDRIDTKCMGKPSFLAVVVPTGDAYTRPDGVHVIPLACLRD